LILMNKGYCRTNSFRTIMKTAIFASLIASAAAFAPSSQQPQVSVSALAATAAELEAMPGKSTEVGGKVVRALML
jgi:hypothetical protein